MKKHGKSNFEHSAGGVIFRKDGHILLLQDRNNQWSFPKGLIEENEDPIKTAEREIEEEVGLSGLQFIDSLGQIKYFYRFKKNLIRKKVNFYLFTYLGDETPKPQADEGIQDVRWFSPEEALSSIGYEKTNKQILEQAIKRIMSS